MRVLHILNELKPSGAEIMLELAAPGWRELGGDLHILSVAQSRGPHAARLEQAGWTIHLFDCRAGRLGVIGALARAIRQIGPDVVHIHSERRILPNCLAVWRCGIPMFRTVHNNFLFGGRLRQQKKLERLICRRLGLRHIAISTSVQSNELQRFANPSQVCWNWFDARRFQPPTAEEKIAARQRLGLPADRPILVSIGNGSDVKNYAAIIGALADPRHRSLLYCQVGLPHPGGRDQALATQHQLGERVRFCGPQDNVLDWLWACDLYVMPSLYEGLSLAAAEALAAGCHCLFASSPGLVDFQEFGVTAGWADPTPAGVAEAIGQSLANPLTESVLHRNSELIREALAVDVGSRAYFDLWVSAAHNSAR